MKTFILIAAAAMRFAAAKAAKLCMIAPGSYEYTRASGSANGTWRLGTGCANGEGSACSSIAASGSATCCAGANCHYLMSGNSNDTGGTQCFCKMTHPKTGLWVQRLTSSTAWDCTDNCAAYCAYNIHSYGDFRAMVLSAKD
ncbi:MAG: hypothetical protein LBL21_01190 [Rickettsiales bacterium]|nr:hypothetical protein [Rickettsiales bacterium]